ncbi:hypothetical protein SynPROS91_00930 [Synechococcus sp. PROS-9-1]|nr:hypothetical protein SynPROS91_00930 [Synechococcus sp. PROS-9-1]
MVAKVIGLKLNPKPFAAMARYSTQHSNRPLHRALRSKLMNRSA